MAGGILRDEGGVGALPLPMSQEKLEFVEELGLYWSSQGNPRMEGRILGYLLITDQPYVSAAQLARDLRASAGSISTCARRLAGVGFIRRHAVAGDRAHYWTTEDDIWGSFLAGERQYLKREQKIAQRALDGLPAGEDRPRRRLENMRDYLSWLEGAHRDLLRGWTEYRDRRPKDEE